MIPVIKRLSKDIASNRFFKEEFKKRFKGAVATRVMICSGGFDAILVNEEGQVFNMVVTRKTEREF